MKSALVTGASSGLGEALTRRLAAERGLTVVATARRLDRLEALRDALPAGKVHVLAGDVGDAAFRARLWSFAEEVTGGVDLLVNNAGIGHYAEFADEDPAVIADILNVNVLALFDLTRLAAKSMRGRGRGEILQISSVLGEFGVPCSATYCASKHAVNGLVKSLRHELRGTGVRVRAALPGRFASEFRSRSMGNRSGEAAPRGGEATDAVARGILRGLDGNRTFFAPTWSAAATLFAATWFRTPFDLLIGAWGKERFAKLYLNGDGRPTSAP